MQASTTDTIISDDGSNTITGTCNSNNTYNDFGIKNYQLELGSSVFDRDYFSVPEPNPIAFIPSSSCVMTFDGHQLLNTLQPSSSSYQRYDTTIMNSFMQQTSMEIVDEIIHIFGNSS